MAVLVLGTAGCRSDLTPVSEVARVRVLAVVAEAPEVAPGAAVEWSALVAAPPGDSGELSYSFVQCTPSEGGCLEYVEALQASGGDEQAAQALYLQSATRAGVGEVEGGVLVAEGRSILTPRTALARGATSAEVGMTFSICEAASCDDEHPGDGLWVATKGLTLSLSDQPNHNPVVAQLTLDGEVTLQGEEAALEIGREHQLSLVLTEGSVETYTTTGEDGEPQVRSELPYVRWFSTAGRVGVPRSEVAEQEDGSLAATSTLTLTEDPGGAVGIYAVVWDGRGGVAWATAQGRAEE